MLIIAPHPKSTTSATFPDKRKPCCLSQAAGLEIAVGGMDGKHALEQAA